MKTFDDHLSAAIHAASPRSRSLPKGECQTSHGLRCNLCYAIDLDYDTEVAMKNAALQSYWKDHFPAIRVHPLVASPRGRAYRAVTKRKVFPAGNSFRLGLIDPSEQRSGKAVDVLCCAIEPPDHATIYARIQESLAKPHVRPLAEQLSYVIIKGSYTEYHVIFNVRSKSAALIRILNTLSKSLTRICEHIAGVYAYEGDSGGRYYLGMTNISSGPSIRKIFGKGEIYQKILGRSFLYSPLSFSQVNPSIIESTVSRAGRLLRMEHGVTLFDLYCGYGLFSLCLAAGVQKVAGVEVSHDAVESAIANAKRQGACNVRFACRDITTSSIQSIMRGASPEDVVLLDPPRGGTAEGVIESIAARSPARVLHLFCNIDLMSNEINRWLTAHYQIATAIPFDMFPGTSAVETMVLFEREKAA